MKDNTVKANNGIDIYTDSIKPIVDEYISTLEEERDIYNKQCFAGLIKYISIRIKNNIDYDNLVQLNDLWNIYTSLCYKYKQTVSIERYCILINISRDTFYNWLNGVHKETYSQELGCNRSDMMKKWDAETESSWQDEASTGNPGAMFVLKARRGWQETAPAQIPQNQNGITKSVDQIAAEMGIKELPYHNNQDRPELDF